MEVVMFLLPSFIAALTNIAIIWQLISALAMLMYTLSKMKIIWIILEAKVIFNFFRAKAFLAVNFYSFLQMYTNVTKCYKHFKTLKRQPDIFLRPLFNLSLLSVFLNCSPSDYLVLLAPSRVVPYVLFNIHCISKLIWVISRLLTAVG